MQARSTFLYNLLRYRFDLLPILRKRSFRGQGILVFTLRQRRGRGGPGSIWGSGWYGNGLIPVRLWCMSIWVWYVTMLSGSYPPWEEPKYHLARAKPGYEVSVSRIRFCSVCRSRAHNAGDAPLLRGALISLGGRQGVLTVALLDIRKMYV